MSKFDFYEYESGNCENDNLEVFNPYDNSLIATLSSDSVSSVIKKINRMVVNRQSNRGVKRKFFYSSKVSIPNHP